LVISLFNHHVEMPLKNASLFVPRQSAAPVPAGPAPAAVAAEQGAENEERLPAAATRPPAPSLTSRRNSRFGQSPPQLDK
jgi:hypothetical protein